MAMAEPIRLILAYANVEYKDIRIERKDWPKRKQTIPWGKVPALELISEGEFLCQSTAIIRYLAKKYELIGEDGLKAAKCDEIAGVVADLRQGVSYRQRRKLQVKNKIIAESFPKYCKEFTEMLKKNNSGYLVGRKLTFVDIVLAYVLGQLRKIVEPKVLEKYPEMTEYEEVVNDHPGIKEWIEERPKTPF